MTVDPTPLTTDDVPDEIVRSIHIDATAETVFAIVSEPGWFINDGAYTEHEITTDGDTSHVVDPVHGTFAVATDVLDPPRRAVFRWLVGQVGELADFPNNTIEFTIDPVGSSASDGVLLTVRERGFAAISDDAAKRRAAFEDNTTGWIQELEIARTLAETRA
ncbi:polyketide cyclase [Brachybacterium sp. FME24]|uniref:polyketide cyclase n=1 Tax=Brachybacterium sp. FME24 TaxID=2742605 RepID=UPI0018677925|nr:polyketide cyclase [Brachybacterium sp. FME24]